MYFSSYFLSTTPFKKVMTAPFSDATDSLTYISLVLILSETITSCSRKHPLISGRPF